MGKKYVDCEVSNGKIKCLKCGDPNCSNMKSVKSNGTVEVSHICRICVKCHEIKNKYDEYASIKLSKKDFRHPSCPLCKVCDEPIDIMNPHKDQTCLKCMKCSAGKECRQPTIPLSLDNYIAVDDCKYTDIKHKDCMKCSICEKMGGDIRLFFYRKVAKQYIESHAECLRLVYPDMGYLTLEYGKKYYYGSEYSADWSDDDIGIQSDDSLMCDI